MRHHWLVAVPATVSQYGPSGAGGYTAWIAAHDAAGPAYQV